MLCITGAGAAAAVEENSLSKDIQLGGYVFWQFGQIVSGYNGSGIFEHQWTNSALIGLRVDACPNERLHLVLSPEFKLNYPFPEAVNHPETVRPFGIAYINEGYGTFSLGNREQPLIEIALGMFTYKYNPEARNLGEYLYRTGTYPTFVVTDFDFARARLLGLRATTDAVTNLHADLLFTSEAFMYPLYDFSLAGIARYDIFNAVSLGAGFELARVLPAASQKTSPEFTKTERPSSYNAYITNGGDTNFYSFKALKVMGQLAIDPKPFLSSAEFFGTEDLKVYGEIAVIGLDRDLAGTTAIDLPDSGYPAFYNDITRRMPVMLGFNFPAFKTLDVLAIELEYFPLMMPNDYYLQESQLSPMPNIAAGTGSYRPSDYRNRSLRWSLYASWEIMKGCCVTGQIAYDHLRTTYWNGSTQTSECMVNKGNWHWELKTGFNF
jgi:hypothetical protein